MSRKQAKGEVEEYLVDRLVGSAVQAMLQHRFLVFVFGLLILATRFHVAIARLGVRSRQKQLNERKVKLEELINSTIKGNQSIQERIDFHHLSESCCVEILGTEATV
jgi:hypothetical protein